MEKTHLISFTFEIEAEDEKAFLETMKEVQAVWETHGVNNYLFRDISRPSRWMHLFLTEKSVDEISSLLQNEPKTRKLFEGLQQSGSRLIVSFMERKI